MLAQLALGCVVALFAPARRRRPIVALASAVGLALVLASCSSGTTTTGAAAPTTAAANPTTTSRPQAAVSEARIVDGAFASASDRTDRSGTVWLCRPGLAADPCAGNLDTSIETAAGTSTIVKYAEQAAVPTKKADCFYVYPTVSEESTQNANLVVQSLEVATAEQQAAQFTRDCNVWAPMYRQVTVNGLFHPTNAEKGFALATSSVLGTFEDYLHHFNHGRPIVLIGHSQGAAMVIRLLEDTMDKNPSLRQRLVSAIILGGNVAVPDGKTVGGTFAHIPLCTSETETGCVIAYSSFLSTPPPGTLFGQPGTGVSALSGQTASKGLEVACTNPAALGGGSGSLSPIFYVGARRSAPYVEYPGLYTATCSHSGDKTWLQVNVIHTPGDTRPVVKENLGAAWGLHIYDVNISLGNLVDVVGREIASWRG